MPDKEIKQIRIAIVQFLRDGDPNYKETPLGEDLYREIKSIEDEDSIYRITYDRVDDKSQFLKIIDEIGESITEPTLLTLHLVTHGCEDGIGIDGDSNFITWREFYDHTRPINIKVHNSLMLVMSVCVGAGMMTCLEPEKRAPFMAFIANTRSVFFKDAAAGFPLFYRKYRTPLDSREALEALNQSIDFSEPLNNGKKKTEFFINSSKALFEEVMNPDRDPEEFRKIALSVKYNDPSMTEEEKIQVAREIIIRDANRFRPYFNFQEVLEKPD